MFLRSLQTPGPLRRMCGAVAGVKETFMLRFICNFGFFQAVSPPVVPPFCGATCSTVFNASFPSLRAGRGGCWWWEGRGAGVGGGGGCCRSHRVFLKNIPTFFEFWLNTQISIHLIPSRLHQPTGNRALLSLVVLNKVYIRVRRKKSQYTTKKEKKNWKNLAINSKQRWALTLTRRQRQSRTLLSQ